MGKLKSFIKTAVAQKRMGTKGGSEGLTGLPAGAAPEQGQRPTQPKRPTTSSLGGARTPMGGGQRLR